MAGLDSAYRYLLRDCRVALGTWFDTASCADLKTMLLMLAREYVPIVPFTEDEWVARKECEKAFKSGECVGTRFTSGLQLYVAMYSNELVEVAGNTNIEPVCWERRGRVRSVIVSRRILADTPSLGFDANAQDKYQQFMAKKAAAAAVEVTPELVNESTREATWIRMHHYLLGEVNSFNSLVNYAKIREATQGLMPQMYRIPHLDPKALNEVFSANLDLKTMCDRLFGDILEFNSVGGAYHGVTGFGFLGLEEKCAEITSKPLKADGVFGAREMLSQLERCTPKLINAIMQAFTITDSQREWLLTEAPTAWAKANERDKCCKHVRDKLRDRIRNPRLRYL